MRRLIIGCGYVGMRVAKHWSARGDAVLVTTRSAEKAKKFREDGLEPIVCDVTEKNSLNVLPSVDTLLFAVGFDRSSGKSIEEVYVEGLSNVLHSGVVADRLIYVSSTGVYGQGNGELVTEASLCEPQRPGGKACLAAEEILRSSSFAESATALRLAGIYGPDRVPNLRALSAGEQVLAPKGTFLNLIHVDDAVLAIARCAEADQVLPLFNVSDNSPVLRRDYYRELATLCEIDPDTIRFVDNASQQHGSGTSESHRAARKAGSKRVCSELIMTTLGLQWSYPSYREGLAAIVQSWGG